MTTPDYNTDNLDDLEETAKGEMSGQERIALAIEHLAMAVTQMTGVLDRGLYGDAHNQGVVESISVALDGIAAAVENAPDM